MTCADYEWDDSKVLLHTLTKACKIKNDRLFPHFPIKFGLFELLLFEVGRKYATQPYLEILFKSLFSLAYYGLMRVGELTLSPHAVKASNVHIGTNKNEILILLYTSKTHDEASEPQRIKISEVETCGLNKKNFCPFRLLRSFISVCGDYSSLDELLFVFADKSPVTPTITRNLLANLLKNLNLDHNLYPFHGFQPVTC